MAPSDSHLKTYQHYKKKILTVCYLLFIWEEDKDLEESSSDLS